jgi:hypothetical protein
MSWIKSKVVMLSTISGNDFPILQNTNGRGNSLHKPTENYYYTEDYLKESKFKAQHLYFLSNEEIKGGDWCVINYEFDSTRHADKVKSITPKGMFLTTESNYELMANRCKKIISSTNEKLNLPTPSKEWIDQYIKAYNTGNPIEEVMIENENVYKAVKTDISETRTSFVIIKVNEANEITIKSIKDSWNREEVDKILEEYRVYTWKEGCTQMELENWKSKNL